MFDRGHVGLHPGLVKAGGRDLAASASLKALQDKGPKGEKYFLPQTVRWPFHSTSEDKKRLSCVRAYDAVHGRSRARRDLDG